LLTKRLQSLLHKVISDGYILSISGDVKLEAALLIGHPQSTVVERLVEIVGRKLTAYIGGVKDVRAVNRWIAGGEIYGEAEARLRFAFQVVRTLSEHDSPAVV
jgi:hypothetical protein